jgi:hypothetical protein
LGPTGSSSPISPGRRRIDSLAPPGYSMPTSPRRKRSSGPPPARLPFPRALGQFP